MRQALLVARRMNDRRTSRPVVLWMQDDIHVGDKYVWDGIYWVVSAVYGTHFSASVVAGRRERPPRSLEAGDAC